MTQIEIQIILHRAASASNVTVDEMLTPSRRNDRVCARAAATLFLTDAGMSLDRVGEILHNGPPDFRPRHHATILSLRRKAENAMGDPAVDPYLHDVIAATFGMADTVNEGLFLKLLAAEGIPAPMTEWRFHPQRRWRLDYCWPEKRLALEVEGGVWVRGRHNRGAGFLNDMEKYNEWAAMGGRLLRVTPKDLCTGETLDLIKRCISRSS